MRALLRVLLVVAIATPVAAQESQPGQTPTRASDLPQGLMSEPPTMTKAINLASKWLGGDGGGPSKDGFYPEFGGMVTGAGWISAGPGYRRHFFDGRLFVDGAAAISWRAYKDAHARVEVQELAGGRLTVGFSARWQDLTQVNYFGIGAESPESERSEYRLRNTDVATYGLFRPNTWLTVGGRLGWTSDPTISSSVGPFDRDFPDARLMFATDPGMAAQSKLVHGGASVEADTRNYPGRPTRGGLYRAAAQVFSDRDLHQFSFQRYDVEGLHVIPVMAERWTLALHGWGVFSDTSAGNEVPFYMLPSLGGGNTVRGYHDYRFHDRHMIVANLESRWALFTHVDLAAFADAGNVAARAGDLDFDKTSYGLGVRVHSRYSTLARLDMSRSNEGWQITFKLSDPFRLARRSLRTSVIPFVP